MVEYTDKEQQVLSLMGKTNFKNLSKNDVFSFVSKINELRPEVAKQVLEQYPEFASLVKSLFIEQSKIYGEIIESDNESTNHVYSILNDEQKSSEESRKLYYEYANNLNSDLNKYYDDSNLTQEEKKDILEKRMEIFRMVDKKDTEIRQHEKNIFETAREKDSEKKVFNWKMVSTLTACVLLAFGIGSGVFGNNFKFKLPKK